MRMSRESNGYEIKHIKMDTFMSKRRKLLTYGIDTLLNLNQ